MKHDEITLKLCDMYNYHDMRLDDAIQTAYEEGLKQGKKLVTPDEPEEAE